MSVEISVLPCTGLHFLLDHEHMRLCAFCYSELPNGKESLGNGDKLSSINQLYCYSVSIAKSVKLKYGLSLILLTTSGVS